MTFKINGNVWKIKEVEKNSMELENTLGETDYENHEIRIWKDCKSKKNTLKHELCHVWLWEYAHLQNDVDRFHFEQVCQIVANSNDFINDIIFKYFGKAAGKPTTIEKVASRIRDKG